MQNENLKRLNEKALSLPLQPGVYIMRDKTGKIIYIGKAVALKNRVSQYFREAGHDNLKVEKMVENVYDFDYIVCENEFEALILEASLIKQNCPKYNILLKDDKGYHYIRLSKGPWRTLSAQNTVLNDGAYYFGPYNSGHIVRETVDSARKAFLLPSCSRSFENAKYSRPCLNYSIGLCCAPCAKKIKLADYEELVDRAVDFINGGSSKSIAQMTEQMNAASEALDFERAAKLRDRINALKKIGEKQHIVASKVKEQDVIAFSRTPEAACFEVFRFKNARLCDNESFTFDALDDNGETRRDFILQYYSNNRDIPRQITLDASPSDEELVKRWLCEKAGHTVILHIPQKGQQRELVEMCAKNAAERLLVQKGRGRRQTAVLDELALLLGLSKSPEYIESYDISHTSGDENVAGMVVFKDAVPYKSAYRRFKIKGFTGQDDYASMHEVISRRFDEYNKASGDEGFGKLPDLILLDGGQGQLNAVLPLLDEYSLDIPVFGMVKDDRHRTRALVGREGEIEIKQTRAVFTLITSIQDEVHRFAISYHRSLREKKSLSSELMSVKGVGEKRAKILLKHFKGITRLKAASLDEISSVKGIDTKTAVAVYGYFHDENKNSL